MCGDWVMGLIALLAKIASVGSYSPVAESYLF
jgi:hypothetical protein